MVGQIEKPLRMFSAVFLRPHFTIPNGNRCPPATARPSVESVRAASSP
jgi:hypothetical protein